VLLRYASFVSTVTDPLLGQTIAGRYLVQEKLGQGGMGAVYLAEQKPLGRKVALKVIRRSLTDDVQAVKRFIQEAKAMASLAHPHVVTVHDFGTLDGSEPGSAEGAGLFIAMEYLEGKSLHRALADARRLPWREAFRIAGDVCRALSAAHEKGVIHRDLKPDNIMLVSSSSPAFVKVLDFGVAKLLDGETATKLTDTGFVVGTPGYIAPEQLEGVQDDPRSDLYALGVILFECIAGRSPFEANTPARLALKHLTDRPPRISEVAPDVGLLPEVEDLVLRLLSKDPAERPPSAQRLRGIIDAILVDSASRPHSDMPAARSAPAMTEGDGIPSPVLTAAPRGTTPMGSLAPPPSPSPTPRTMNAPSAPVDVAPPAAPFSTSRGPETPETGFVRVATSDDANAGVPPWKRTPAPWKADGPVAPRRRGPSLVTILLVGGSLAVAFVGALKKGGEDPPPTPTRPIRETAPPTVMAKGLPEPDDSSAGASGPAPSRRDSETLEGNKAPLTEEPPEARASQLDEKTPDTQPGPESASQRRKKLLPKPPASDAPRKPTPTAPAPPPQPSSTPVPSSPERDGAPVDEEGRAVYPGLTHEATQARAQELTVSVGIRALRGKPPVVHEAAVQGFVDTLGLKTVKRIARSQLRDARRLHERGEIDDAELEARLREWGMVEDILKSMKHGD